MGWWPVRRWTKPLPPLEKAPRNALVNSSSETSSPPSGATPTSFRTHIPAAPFSACHPLREPSTGSHVSWTRTSPSWSMRTRLHHSSRICKTRWSNISPVRETVNAPTDPPPPPCTNFHAHRPICICFDGNSVRAPKHAQRRSPPHSATGPARRRSPIRGQHQRRQPRNGPDHRADTYMTDAKHRHHHPRKLYMACASMLERTHSRGKSALTDDHDPSHFL